MFQFVVQVQPLSSSIGLCVAYIDDHVKPMATGCHPPDEDRELH